MVTKQVSIRVVRCPRCRVLLPELPDHPLYRCGNCETVIQAKNNKLLEPDLNGMELDVYGGVVISGSEEPFTSPDTAVVCQRNEHPHRVADNDELSRKGKSKLELLVPESRSPLPVDDEMKQNHEYIIPVVLLPDNSHSHSHSPTPSEGHVSLYLTSPDQDEDRLHLSPSLSLSKNGAAASYYGSESSCEETDDHHIARKRTVPRRDGKSTRRRRRNNLQPPQSESEKLDLLKTVWELKHQLNKMHLSKDKDGNFAPENHHHHRFSRPASLAKSMQQYERPMSSCYCHPHRSSQFPFHCNHNCDASSPQQHTRMTQCGVEERKIHLLPVAGGAPFVTCYNCWEVLRIPAEFIVIRKRYHKLMCSSCRRILRFSLNKATHLAPRPKDDGLRFRGSSRRRKTIKELPRSTSPLLHHLMA